ncbi:cytosolic iron-sulfur assembly component 2A isoform X1 [Hydra vulgaris]|uniref:Cytosolic iron-sulfur assembly component 2A isoform X1 n=1 Tax=Hydra vulgaris TaxID=6087 RepID=A0ABM4DAZ2_HYDVU
MSKIVNLDCFDLVWEVYDIIRTIKDPERVETLEELHIVSKDLVQVNHFFDQSISIKVQFVPTVPHCSLASLIGLCIYVKLQENLLCNFKLDINIKENTHYKADAINKQMNDKERVAAALENPDVMKIVKQCI